MALRVLADFEHAAVEKVRVDEAGGRIYFAAPLGDSPRGMWFHFKVEGANPSRPVTFVLTNVDQMLGTGNYKRAVPVYRAGDRPWRRVDPATCAEQQIPLNGLTTELKRVFQFVVPAGPGPTEVAFCFPYTAGMIDEALSRWRKEHGVKVETIGRSGKRRPLRVACIGTPGKGKKVVWLLARQHAGEVAGSFVAEGLADAVLGKSAWAKSFRRRCVLYVCLAADIDGVSEGMYGKDRVPIDFNRDWRGHPQRVEVAALRKAMEASRIRCAGAAGRMMLFLDLHGPSAGDVSFPVPPHPAWAGRDAWQRAWWFGRLVERLCPEQTPIRWANSHSDHIDWSAPMIGGRTASTFHAACKLADVSMTFELTYHWHANNRLVDPPQWRQMGAAIGRAAEAFARDVRPPRNAPPPEPPYYLSPFWGWLNVPRDCNAKVHEDIVSIQAEGNQGYAALLFAEPIPLGRGRFAAAAAISRTSHGKCPMQRLIFYSRRGVLTGEACELKGELGSQNTLQWRAPAARRHPADAAYLAVILRNWPGTITIGRPVRI